VLVGCDGGVQFPGCKMRVSLRCVGKRSARGGGGWRADRCDLFGIDAIHEPEPNKNQKSPEKHPVDVGTGSPVKKRAARGNIHEKFKALGWPRLRPVSGEDRAFRCRRLQELPGPLRCTN